MPRPPPTVPTELELAILNILWGQGPSTVGQTHQALKQLRGTTYSTTLKMIQVMTDKGLLLVDDSRRPQIYRPARREEQTQLQLVDHLIQRAFGGSAVKLVLSAVSAKRLNPDELAAVKQLLQRESKSEHE